MSSGFSTAVRDARLQVIIDALDAGAGSFATIELYGAGVGRPATGIAVTDQTLIATLTLSNPNATISAGVLTFAAIAPDNSADADEDIEWARFFDTDGNFVCDMGCGIAASGQELIFNTLTAKIGGAVIIISGTITEGNV